MRLSTLDCPVNCPYLMLETWGCGCDYGFVPGAPIVERIGGDAVITDEPKTAIRRQYAF